MILSVSRRTDVPNYYSDWFFNRIKEGFVYVRNPMNVHQVSKIDLSPDVVDCIVFWTKNPEPMIDRLDELKAYKYYFQFTLTGYGRDIEPGVPHKRDVMIPVFQRLSEKTGREKIIWRYDPVMFTEKYTPEYHFRAFGQIAEALKGYTDKCVISFADIYEKNRKRMDVLKTYSLDSGRLMDFAQRLARIAQENNMETGSCAEKIDLEQCGIKHNCCIDKKLIETITGFRISARKDGRQRSECGCIESTDIGTYNTCKNGCIYCYANGSQEKLSGYLKKYDPLSPFLCGEMMADDKINRRKVKSVKEEPLAEIQMSLFDI